MAGDEIPPAVAECICGAAAAIELNSLSVAHAGAQIVIGSSARTSSLGRKTSMNVAQQLLTKDEVPFGEERVRRKLAALT